MSSASTQLAASSRRRACGIRAHDPAFRLQGERDVLRDAELADDALGTAVLRGVDDAQPHRRARAGERALVPGPAGRPRAGPLDPGHRAGELGPAGPEQARDPEHLTRHEVDVGAADAGRGEAARAEVRRLLRPRDAQPRRRPPRDLPCPRASPGRGRSAAAPGSGTRPRSVPSRRTVTRSHSSYTCSRKCDTNRTAAPRVPEPADDAEELGALVGVEAGGGLVEHEHPDVGRDRPRDRHELLHRERVRAQLRRDVQGDPEVRQRRVRPLRIPAQSTARTVAVPCPDRCSPRRRGWAAGRSPGRRTRRPRAAPPAGCGRRAGAPSSVMTPAASGSAPVIALISVDLPAPFSPMSEWISPGKQPEVDAVERGLAAEHARGAPQLQQGLRPRRARRSGAPPGLASSPRSRRRSPAGPR